MKAILLAGLTGVLFLVVMTLMLRLRPVRGRALQLTGTWLVSMPLLALAYSLTPPDLGFLPLALRDDPPWFGLPFCLGIWAAEYLGGLLQLYNLAERGLSLRLLIEIGAVSERTGGNDGQTGVCSGNSPICSNRECAADWMLVRRLGELEAAGLIEREDGWVNITPSARRPARWLRRLRSRMRLSGWT